MKKIFLVLVLLTSFLLTAFAQDMSSRDLSIKITKIKTSIPSPPALKTHAPLGWVTFNFMGIPVWHFVDKQPIKAFAILTVYMGGTLVMAYLPQDLDGDGFIEPTLDNNIKMGIGLSMILGSYLYSVTGPFFADSISERKYEKELKKYTLEYTEELVELTILQEQLEQKKEEERIVLKQKKEEERIVLEQKKEEERITTLNYRFSEREVNHILCKQIFIGMSEAALLESWGRPEDINSTTSSYGVHKQYCYNNIYVYVENGYIDSWQEF